MPKLEDTAANYKMDRQIRAIERAKPEDLVSPGVMKRMKEMFAEQGCSDIEVKIKIRKQCELIKQTQIKNLEKN